MWSQIKDFLEDTAQVREYILKTRQRKREHYRGASKREKPKNLTQSLRVMMWAFDTIDDLDLIRRAFDAAWSVVSEEKKT